MRIKMDDISNRDLKDFLKEQNSSLKHFIEATAVNVKQLNDNQVAHSKELLKTNQIMETWAKIINKVMPKMIWLILILIGLILAMAGYDFFINKLM